MRQQGRPYLPFDGVFVLAVEVLELERLLEFLFMKSGSSLRKMSYTVQKNVCITFGSRVRFALENVLRLAGVMPRTRDSSAAYIFETSTISLRLNRCRNCESISRYTCELYENFLALTFSPDAISSIFHPGMCSCTIWAKHDIILFRVALGFLLLIVYPFVCSGGAAQGNAFSGASAL